MLLLELVPHHHFLKLPDADKAKGVRLTLTKMNSAAECCRCPPRLCPLFVVSSESRSQSSAKLDSSNMTLRGLCDHPAVPLFSLLPPFFLEGYRVVLRGPVCAFSLSG